MADSEQVIRLTGREDIHALRMMLSRAQAPRLLIVVPKGHPALQQLVRVKMLARQAYAEGRQLALVTHDARIRELAHQMNLSTFRSVEAGRKARHWREGQSGVVTPNGHPSSETLAWGRGRHAVMARRQQIGARSNWGEHIMLAGLVFGMVIVLSAILLLLVPSASITLVPRQVPLETTFPVTIDPTAREIDFGDEIVPGRIVRQDVQGTMEMATSGRRDVPAGVATGEVLFINVTGQPVTIPVNTIVSTSTGSPVRFRTTEAAALPGEINARVAVPVEALAEGPQGNVAPQQINRVEGAAATAVRVLNQAPIEGGGVQQRAVVTAADREQLREQLRQQLFQQGRTALDTAVEEAGEDEFLISDIVTMEIVAENYNGSVDDQLDVLRLDLRARMTGIVVSQADVARLARRRLEGQVPASYRMLEESVTVVPGEAQVVDDGLPTMAVRAGALTSALLSGDEIRALVRGQPIDEAHAALLQRLPLAADPSIIVTPDWWNRMPYLPLRIFIRVGVLGPNQEPLELLPGEEPSP